MATNQTPVRTSRRDINSSPEAALPRAASPRRMSTSTAVRKPAASAKPVEPVPAKEADPPAKAPVLKRRSSTATPKQATRVSAPPAPSKEPRREREAREPRERETRETRDTGDTRDTRTQRTMRRRSDKEESTPPPKNELAEMIQQASEAHYDYFKKRHERPEGELDALIQNLLQPRGLTHKVMGKLKKDKQLEELQREQRVKVAQTMLHEKHTTPEAEYRSWRRQEILKGVQKYVIQENLNRRQLEGLLGSVEVIEEIADDEFSLTEDTYNALFRMFCRMPPDDREYFLNALLLKNPETLITD